MLDEEQQKVINRAYLWLRAKQAKLAAKPDQKEKADAAYFDACRRLSDAVVNLERRKS